jgi:carbon storage regulator
MLVLTRKNGETICISREIEVTVLSISRNVVKLGFSAPPQVDIRRQELKSTSARSRSNKSPSSVAVYS